MSWPVVTTPGLRPDQVEPCGVVLVVGPDPDEVQRVAAGIGAVSGVTGLPALVMPLLVGWDMGSPDLGPPSLVEAERWLRAVRRLALDVVGAPAVVAAPGPLWGLMYLRRVLPDATVVLALTPGADAEWDTRLPELQQPGDLVAPVAVPAPPRRRRSWRRPVRSAGRRVVVLLGSGRSGTTWLHAMLCASPEVAGTELGETSLFRMLAPLWEAHGDDPRVTAAMRGFLDDVLLDALAPDGRGLVCEKTPDHAHLVPMIRALLPRAALVHLVRDGRDVAMSLHAIDGAYPDLAAAAQAWSRAVTAVERDLDGAPRQRVVRYEDLLDDAVPVVTDLWHWLGARPDVDELRRRVGRQVTPLPSRLAPGSRRWESLSAEDLATVTEACGPALQRWGYTG